jgi:5-methyltetrahydropteroyltriglutamate--homocysteine methyltransferase
VIATVVGSYPKIPNRPRPARLRIAINRFDRGEITEAELARVADEVTVEVIQEQVNAGLDLITDGQIRWEDEQTYIARELTNVSINGLIRWFDTNMYYRQPVIEGAVAWQWPITVRDYRFAVEHSPKPVKPVLTGPYTLALLSKDTHYGALEPLVRDLAAALNREARALQDAGARLIQFNEPALVRRKDGFSVFAKACPVLLDGVTAETALYTYFGDVDGIYPAILDLPFDVVGLDFVEGARNWEVIRRTPFTKKLAAGIVDARNTRMETVDQIIDRIRTLRDAGIDIASMHVNPTSGLEFLPREVAEAKLRRLVEGVRKAEEALT